jgi:hypothetical protein
MPSPSHGGHEEAGTMSESTVIAVIRNPRINHGVMNVSVWGLPASILEFTGVAGSNYFFPSLSLGDAVRNLSSFHLAKVLVADRSSPAPSLSTPSGPTG